MSVLSTGFSQGTKGLLQQLGVPLHTVPPPTGPSLSSSPCRCQIYPRPSYISPVKWL